MAEGIDTSRPIATIAEAKSYGHYLSEALKHILEATVPWRKALVYATPWWSPKVALAVKAAKLAQREWLRTRDPAYKQEAIRLREA